MRSTRISQLETAAYGTTARRIHCSAPSSKCSNQGFKATSLMSNPSGSNSVATIEQQWCPSTLVAVTLEPDEDQMEWHLKWYQCCCA